MSPNLVLCTLYRLAVMRVIKNRSRLMCRFFSKTKFRCIGHCTTALMQQFCLCGIGFYPRDVVSAVLATATWVAGWVPVTTRYCIKMAKPILKRFRPSGCPIILVPSDPAPIPDSKENPFSGDINTRGGKNWRFSTEISVYFGNSGR